MEIGKRKTKIEINTVLNEEIVKKIETFFKELAKEYKINDLEIKKNQYLNRINKKGV